MKIKSESLAASVFVATPHPTKKKHRKTTVFLESSAHRIASIKLHITMVIVV
jgi:hypothetical protein